MQTVLVALNAQYMHTNLAVRSIAAYLEKNSSVKAQITECTINMQPETILEQLYEQNGDIYIFSCYIWNVDLICRLGKELKKIRPHAVLAVGGPQVSYHCKRFLQANPAFDIVLVGEGELTVLQLLESVEKKQGYASCSGLWFWNRETGEILQNPAAPRLEMDALPFAYKDLEEVKGRILYYESMRGCPFGCSYCLSSIERGVRIKSVELVCKELQRFIQAGVKQVKFVDRTFNANKTHALAIWKYLAQEDNGYTNFHFELAGEILDQEMLAFLAGVRPGLFQFEIGVQSTNETTLQEISRPANLPVLFQNIQQLQSSGNIHLHLDLIAGLPYEDFATFTRSFNHVYGQRPQQFQLGFLKVLGGSGMEENAESYGLVWEDAPPFELLFTRWISYQELVQLKGVAAMVEQYYNSGRFARLVEYLVAYFDTPFAFYLALWEFYLAGGYRDSPLSKIGYYDLLGRFMEVKGIEITQKVQWLCRYDLALHEKIKALPYWVKVNGAQPYRYRVVSFYEQEENITRYLPQYAGREPKQILKMAHIEVFPFNPDTGEGEETALLFNYMARDITGRAKRWQIILPIE